MRWVMFKHDEPPTVGVVPRPTYAAHLMRDGASSPIHPEPGATVATAVEPSGLVLACARCMWLALEER